MPSLHVATFNLCSGRSPGDGRIEPERLTEAIAALDVDVLAVQEVDVGQPRSGGVDQLATVAAAFGAVAQRFVPAMSGVPGSRRTWKALHGNVFEPLDGVRGYYGAGLVSRLPVLAWRARRLTASRAVLPLMVVGSGGRRGVLLVPDEPRVAVAAVVQTPAGPVTVISTHLSFAPVAAVRQLRTVVRWARTLPGPRLLAGDLNLPGRLPGRLTRWRPLAAAATYPAAHPRVQLDHLLTDAPAGEPGGRAEQLAVSDHRAVIGRHWLP